MRKISNLFLKILIIYLPLSIETPLMMAQHVLSIDECLTIARKNSPNLRIAATTVQSTRLGLEILKKSGLPQVKIGVSTVYAPTKNHFGYDPAITNGGQIGGQIFVEQPLYDAGIRQLKSVQLDLELGRLEQVQYMTDRDIVFTVREAYIELLKAQEETVFQTSSVAELGEYLDLVTTMYNGGNASYTDVLKTELQLSSAKITLEKAVELEIISRFTLSQAMGIAPDTTLRGTGTLRDIVPNNIDSKLIAQPDSSFTNLELQIAQIEIEKSSIDVELAQRDRLPTVFLTADAGLLTSYDNLRLPVEDRASMAGVSVGIAVELPVLTWGAIDMRSEQRALDVQVMKEQNNLLRQAIATERRKLLLQLRTSLGRLETLKKNIALSEKNYILMKAKFTAGAALSIEVLSAQQLLVDARLANLQTEAETQLLTAKLEQLTTSK